MPGACLSHASSPIELEHGKPASMASGKIAEILGAGSLLLITYHDAGQTIHTRPPIMLPPKRPFTQAMTHG